MSAYTCRMVRGRFLLRRNGQTLGIFPSLGALVAERLRREPLPIYSTIPARSGKGL